MAITNPDVDNREDQTFYTGPAGNGTELTGPLSIGASATDTLGFYGVTPVVQQNVPLTTPTVQDVIDALVALGLVEQSD